VEKKLEAAAGQIFKPGGKNPIINKLFRELRALDQTIYQRMTEIERYDDLRNEISEVTASVEAQREFLQARRARLERVKLLELGWEDWVDLGKVQKELTESPAIEAFPEDGIARLERLLGELRSYNARNDELVSEIERLEKRIAGLEPRPEWLAAAEQIRLLERGLDGFTANCKELTELCIRLEKEKQALEKDLEALGPGWNIEWLEQFDTSVSAREEIQGYQEALRQARDAERYAERSLDQLKEAFGQIEQRTQTAETTLGQLPEPEEKDQSVLTERRLEIRVLLNLVHNRRNLESSLGQLQERKQDLLEQQNGLFAQLEGIAVMPLWWLAMVAAVVAGSGLAISHRWGLNIGMAVAGGGLLLILILLGLTLWQRRKQRVRADLLREQMGQVTTRLESLQAVESDLLDQKSANDRDIELRLSAVGCSEQPTFKEIDRLEANTESEQETLKRWQLAHDRLEECREALHRAQEERDRANKALSIKRDELQRVEQGWRGWLTEAGLAEGLSPTTALEVMERIRSLRQQGRAMAELEERQGSSERLVRAYHEEVLASAEQVESGEFLGKEPEVIVHHLVLELKKAEDEQKDLETFANQLEDCRSQQGRNGLHIRELEKELEDLFEEGGAENEAQFRQRALIYKRRLRINEGLELHRRNLEKLGGRGEDQIRFQEELRQCSPERLSEEKSDLEQEVLELEREHQELREKHVRLDQRREQLESAEELSTLRQNRSVLVAELADATHRWSAVKVCLTFLKGARQVYEKERKQPVVRESENFFRAITDDRYQAILAPHGEESIRVIGSNGNQYDLDILSRGTAEQLYLSLRFGYIREFGRRARPLPVAMDDVLVNFDPRRARAAIRGMLELARKNQVLFFTCHPESVALIKESDQSVPVYRLEGGNCAVAQ
jgi:uncharacterized protein YhaN